MTEKERYEVRDPTKRKKAKQTPQEAWMELLTDSIPKAPSHLRQNLTEISTRENVPRKEKQFRNFVANSMRIPHSAVEEIWKFLKELQGRKQAAREEEKRVQERKAAEELAKVEKAKEESDFKASCKHDDIDNQTNHPLPSSEEVKKAMKKILKKEEAKAMPIKSLQKAVCAKFSLEKKGKKHMKKLLKEQLLGKKFAVDGKIVRLKVD